MSVQDDIADLLPGAPLSKAAQIVRRMSYLYIAFAVFIAGLLTVPLWPARLGLAKVRLLAREMITGGIGVTTLVAVLLSLVALAATVMMTESRLRRRRIQAAQTAGELPPEATALLDVVWNFGPSLLARQGQAALLTVAMIVMALLAKFLWPAAMPMPPIRGDANLAAAIIIGLSFPSLMAERMLHAFPAGQMPEAPLVRRLLLLTTLIMAASGVFEIGRSVGFAWVNWVQRGLLIVSLLIMAELFIRSLGRLFLPPPHADVAKAAVDSIIAALLTGGPRAPAMLIRTHLGLDFARSWALSYIAKAAIPAVLATALLCWFLSGVKLLDGNQRGVYQRLGAPVAVLGPGLHLLLPWPLGRLRPVEYGTIHTVFVASDQNVEVEKVGVEDNPPASMNQLWDTAHLTEAQYLVASPAVSQGAGEQGFQAVSSEIRVLYRTGLTDQAAMQVVYAVAEPEMVVRQEASRLATRYFSSHTLDMVMGGQRESLEESLRVELQRAVTADHAGVDIVAVVIQAIHPPAGAAAAYHAVQAAEIAADASVSNATGKAFRTMGEAQEEAQRILDVAQASATERIQAAIGDAYQFDADRKGNSAGSASFLLERRNRNLVTALRGMHLTIMDARLSPSQGLLIDLRNNEGGAPAGLSASDLAAATTTPSVEGYVSDQPTRGTSSEGPAPPGTAEDAAEQAREAARKP